jgi:hypothetical protein
MALGKRYRTVGMRPTIALIAVTERPSHRLMTVGVSGCLLALIVGVLGATHYGVLVAAGFVGLSFSGLAAVLYLKDPVLALIALWLFEVFNAPVSAAFGYFSTTGEAIRQGDEVLVLFFAGLTIWRTLRTTVRMPALRFVLPGLGIGLCGLLGAIIHGVPVNVTLTGALLGLKFWIMVVLTLLLPWTSRDLGRVYGALTKVGVIVAALGIADYLTHGAVSRALHTSDYGIRQGGYRSEAVHSVFPNPGEYSLFMSLLFAVAFARFTKKYGKSDLLLALLFAGSVMLSLRLKGFLSLAAVVGVVACVQAAASGPRAVGVLLVGVVLVASAYGLEKNVLTKQISTYASSETSARSRLYSTGEQIASEDFPLGVGFGRFASYPSRLYYSPVYYQYKLSRVYGLSRTYPDFIDDTSWPSVIGETGYGGFAIYIVGFLVLILTCFRLLRKASSETRWVPLAGLCSIAVLLVDSLGDPTLFEWLSATMFAMILGPMLIAVRPMSKREADEETG